MSDWNTYRERLTKQGATERDRLIDRIQSSLQVGMSVNPSVHTVQVGNRKMLMGINSTQVGVVKQFFVMPDQKVDIGDYVLYNHRYWLVTEREHDDEVYIRGRITECNFLMKWQNEKGDIIQRWCIFETISKYNNGVYSGRFISNIESTISATMGADQESVMLKRDKRIMADVIDVDPYVYKITQRDVLTSRFDNHGIVTIGLTQDVFNDATDNVALRIADYVPIPVRKHGIVGSDTIRLGASSSYASTEEDPIWTVDASDMEEFSYSQMDSVLTLKAPKLRDYVGYVIHISDGVNSMDVQIRGVF